MKFRVWCTSWGETDEDGMDVEKCSLNEQIDDIIGNRMSMQIIRSPFVDDAMDAAEKYAEYAHDHRDGYESSWPLNFRVRAEDGTISDFEIDRDFEPIFSAAPIKVADGAT